MRVQCTGAVRPTQSSVTALSRRRARQPHQRCCAQNDPFRTSAATSGNLAAGSGAVPAGFLAPGVSRDALVQVRR